MVTGRFVPSHAVDRTALRRILDVALERPLTLIVAPAGAGKSVLLTQWTNSHPEVPCAWVDVVHTDNDAIRFARHLQHALAALAPAGRSSRPLVRAAGGGLGLPLLEVLAADWEFLGETVLVLDDLQHLSNKAIISDLGRLIEMAPANIHVVLSSRVDLPIAWTRNRMRSEVTEIRQAELAMSHAESAELLHGITGFELAEADVSVLVDRTEGWTAGLQLAGMTIRLHPDPAEFIAQFGGSDRLVADYLSEEVLQALSPVDRKALLEISVLDQMSIELVAHVTSTSVARRLLVHLDAGGMFLIPSDDLREWFRFHHLFRDLLRYRIRNEVPGAEERILTAAAAWHHRRGEAGPAIEYLLRAHEWDQAIDAILGCGNEVLDHGTAATAVQWINAVPESVRSSRTEIDLLLALLETRLGYPATAEDVLREVAAKPNLSQGEVACTQTFLAALAQWRPDPGVSADHAERALAALAKLGDGATPDILHLTDPGSLEAMALISGGRAHFYAGNVATARRWLERGLASRGARFSSWRIGGLGSLALVEAWCGHAPCADELATAALTLGRETGKTEHPATADAYVARSVAAMSRADGSAAEMAMREGRARAAADHRTQLTWVAESALAALDVMQARPASSLPSPPAAPLAQQQLAAVRARKERLAGSAAAALQMLEGLPAPLSASVFEQAAAQLSLGRLDAAQASIDKFATVPDRHEPLARVRRMILLSWQASLLGLNNSAAAHLSEALRVAEPEGLVAVFLGAGPFIVKQVSRLGDGLTPVLQQAILDRSTGMRTTRPVSTLTKPLTRREKDLLALLPSRLTNEELAQRFYVSVNTIKTHLAHIYRKLDASDRSAAIRRATDAGLLH